MHPCLIFAQDLHLLQNVHTSYYICKISQTKCPSWPPSHLQGRRWNFSWNARAALLQMDPSRPRYYFASSSKFASTSNGPLRTELIFCPFSLGSPNHLLANKLEKYLNRNTPSILKEYLESNEYKHTKIIFAIQKSILKTNIWNSINTSIINKTIWNIDTSLLKECLEFN